ncbi:MAG: right-handed parallel beta-helix repeat-containing protein [Lentisphaerae bacterium]|nr:right-handed parallel beta-helix repeat-containing protein [Lentisphaerota bacterium]
MTRITQVFAVLSCLCLCGTSATGAIHYVDPTASGTGSGTTWPNAFTNLQTALTAAATNDEVRVAAGTYTPSDAGDRMISFALKTGMSLMGGYPHGGGTRDWATNLTILSGDINAPGDPTDNSAHVVVGAHLARLDGFTITKGYWDSNDDGPRDGAGLYVNGNKVMTVVNCRFIDNHSWYRGAGIYFGFTANSATGPVISNCTFQGNSTTYGGAYGGGVYIYNRTPATIIDSTFEDNTSANGAAFGSQYADPTIRNCTFARNVSAGAGGAVWISRPDATAISPSVISNCSFFANRAAGGGGALYVESVNYALNSITGCRFHANEATNQGGAIYVYRYDGAVEDCVFSDNRSLNHEGGAIANYYGSPILRRLVAVGNRSGYRGGAFFVGGHGSYPTSPRFENVLAAGNVASYWGGALSTYYLYGSTVTVVNCTFTSNRTVLASSSYGGGAIWLEESKLSATNTVLHGNRAAGGSANEVGVIGAGSRTTWGHNDLAGGVAGFYNPQSATNHDQVANIDTNPAFASVTTGAWTLDGVYSTNTGMTILRDDDTTWLPGSLAGSLLNPDTTNMLIYAIFTNTDHTITILGNASAAATGDAYQFVDYRLTPASACIDAGQREVAPPHDLTGAPRPRGLGYDIGAYETLLTGDSIAPGPVTALSAAGGQASVQLNWTNPTDEDFASVLVLRRSGAAPTGVPVSTNTYFKGDVLDDGVVVYAGPGSNGAPGAASGFTDEQLDDQVLYHYAVYTTDRVPNYGPAAATSALTEFDVTPPSPVAALTAVATDAQISFVWTNPPQVDYAGVLVLRRTDSPPSGAPTNGGIYTVGSAIGDGTVVYRGPASSATPGARATWTDVALPNETNYYYRFFAYDEQPLYAAAADTNGLPVARNILYVNLLATPGGDGTSWASAFTSLTQALARAGAGTNVWVSAGTYKPGNTRTSTFQLTNGCSILGGFNGSENSASLRDWKLNPTILSGEIGGPTNTDNILHVVTATGADGAVLDGFTVTRGYAWESGNDTDPSRDGGGLLLWEGAGVPTRTDVRNCRFVDNAANYLGGAMCLAYSQGASVGAVVSNCVFENNYTFRSSDGYGGAIYTYHYRPLWVFDSTFTSNRSFYAGAIRSNLGDLMMHRSTLTGNVAGQSVGAVWNSRNNTASLRDLEIVDCVFAANQAPYYGAVRLERNYLTGDVVRGCRFYANRSSGGAAALHLYAYNGLVEDTVISGNTMMGANQGGALYLEYAGPVLRNVSIVGTESHYRGGGIFGTTAASLMTSPRLENVLIAGNLTRYDGGGVCLYDFNGNTSTFVNCTIVDNRTYEANPTYYGGGGLYMRGCAVSVTNTILYGNTTAGAGAQVRLSLSTTPVTAGYSDLDGGVAGIHNPDGALVSAPSGMVSALPGFLDDATGTWTEVAAYDASVGLTTFSNAAAVWAPGGLVGKYLNPNAAFSNLVYYIAANTPSTITVLGDASKVTNAAAAYRLCDYRLKAISACVDAGTAAGVTNDLAGQSRPQGYGYDIGAYERIPDGLPPASVGGLQAVGGLDQITLSWTNPSAADFTGVLVVRRTGSAPVGEPVSTNLYPPGSTIGNGTVVYAGTGNSATPGAASGWVDTGLDQLATYHYAIYASDAVPNFSPRADASATTLPDSTRPAPVSGLQAAGGTQQAVLTWMNSPSADSHGVLILRREGPTPPSGEPVANATYTAGDIIGDGTVVYVGPADNGLPGAAASWTNTGLNNLTRYAYAVYAYDEVPNYSTSTGDDTLTGLPGVLFVNDDATGAGTGFNWDDAFSDLQDALRAAVAGNQIWVAEGTYYPTNGTSRSVVFSLKANVTLYGGFSGTESVITARNWKQYPTILSGDIGTLGAVFDNSERLVYATAAAAGAGLDGFILEKVYGTQQGGALRVDALITVRHCIFRDNQAYEGAAVHNGGGANVVYSGCEFYRNSSTHRGGAFQQYSSSPRLENCVFAFNSCAPAGGALALYHQRVDIVNCTFFGNTSDGGGAFYASAGADVYCWNCIFWDTGGNSGGGIWIKNKNDNDAQQVTVDYSDVLDGWSPPPGKGSGANNINAEPLFANTAADDYHLLVGSPGIDVGTPADAPVEDLEGGARPHGSAFDMGAYEFGALGPGTPPEALMLIVR